MFKFSLFFSFEESQRRALNQIQEHHLVRSTRFPAHAPWNSEPRGANTVGSCKAPRCWYTLLCSQQHQHSQEQGPFLDCKVIQFFRHSLANFKISIPPIMNTCLGNDFPCRHLTCWEDGREARFTDILFCKKAHTLQVKHILFVWPVWKAWHMVLNVPSALPTIHQNSFHLGSVHFLQ